MDWKLKQKQSLPLEAKIILAQRRIKEWYEHFEGQVYVAFSGGKDSTVLLHLVRELYPEVPAVFVDTGLEFPEIRRFAVSVPNLVILKPELTFKQITVKYGWPVVSKEQSQFLFEARNTNSEKLLKIRLEGNAAGRGKISEKWKFLLKAPFPISHKCCDIMKKNPSKRYEKETGRKPFIGRMASESQLRQQNYKKNGCNAFTKRGTSDPLSVWLEGDIWEYLKTFEVLYSPIYDMGYERTGCFRCMFGCDKDAINTFQRMQKTHPKIHSHVLGSDQKKVLDFLDIPYE